MVKRFSKLRDVRSQSGVIFSCRAGMEFRATIGIESFCCCQSAGELNTLKHYVHVPGVRKVVGADCRRVQRIRRTQTDIAPAEWVQQSGPHSECVAFDLLESMLNKIADAKVELQIGNLGARGGFNKSSCLCHVRS